MNWRVNLKSYIIYNLHLDFICRQRVLKANDQACLDEKWTGAELVHEEEISPADENHDEL